MPKYETTPWTPELVPDAPHLPPNIDPPLIEPVYRKNGEVIRTTQERRHESVCLDPECPLMWEGHTAFPNATQHTSQTGHLTKLYYAAEFTISINPFHPKHRGKVRTTLLSDTPQDLPESKRPRLAPTPPVKEPETNPESHARAVRRARKTAIQTDVAIDAQEVLRRTAAAKQIAKGKK
jgi:hypothetical protein